MAQKIVTLSDLSGAELDDATHARIVFKDHPQLRGNPVALDVSVEEAQKLQPGNIALVTMEVHEPNVPMRRVVMDAASLGKLFKGVDMDALVAGAQPVAEASQRPSVGRGRPKGSTNKPKADTGVKRDYSSPEWAGVLHRGKITEAEKEWVRENLAKAQENRKREGQQLIDPESEADQRRYFT